MNLRKGKADSDICPCLFFLDEAAYKEASFRLPAAGPVKLKMLLRLVREVRIWMVRISWLFRLIFSISRFTASTPI